jgi:glyoxylase-like metal-dependent hydrolase (beta-lactamase superfamily II)
MWVPTTSVLERLLETGARTAAEVAARLNVEPDAPPRIVEERDDLVRLAFGAAGALPGRPVVASVIGRRELVVVDPGDPSEEAIRAIEAIAAHRGATFRAIVLTSTDPDHAAGAEALAIPHEVPVLVAPGAGRRLPYATREVIDGERLPADVELRVRLAPDGATLEIEHPRARSAGE